MKYMDAWGNKYDTKEEAKENLLKIYRGMGCYWREITNGLDALEILEWINEKNLLDEFKKHFQAQIQTMEEAWLEWDIDASIDEVEE
jgi:hypothetical protein